MYKIVYVLIDNDKLKFFNELMISVKSVRKHMKKVGILVITDKITYQYIADKYDILAGVLGTIEFVVENVPNEYNSKEKSRYLKTSIRRIVSGDLLFLDTDTILCEALSDVICDSDIAMVLDKNIELSMNPDQNNVYEFCAKCGVNIQKTSEYFNTGVIWMRDSDLVYSLFEKWHQKWRECCSNGYCFDQPILNFVNQRMGNVVDTLNMRYNVQISAVPFPIRYINDAAILHYFNLKESPYLLCSNEEEWNSEKVEKIINNPLLAFDICKLERLDKNMVIYSKQYKVLSRLYTKYSKLFNFNEKVLKLFFR